MVPVGLVEKDPTKGTFHMTQHYSKEDNLGVSMNSQLDSDDFLTCWNSAYTMANYVSAPFLDPPPPFFSVTLVLVHEHALFCTHAIVRDTCNG